MPSSKASDLFASFRLDGRVALVTGASKGIGEAMARALAAAGAHVVVSSRSQEAVDAVAASIRADGGEATGRAIHVGRTSELAGHIEAIADALGRLDVLVNNAATNPVYGPIEATPLSAFDKIFEVNVKGPFALATAALPFLREGGGSVINVSSVGGARPEPGLGVYSASKAALVSLTQAMAREWGPHGVRVNAICPGLIKTTFSEALWRDEAMRRRIEHDLPLRRIGTSADLAGLALFLASDASAYCTGGVFTADGGFLLS